ncbi:ATPase family associated with various cellular activities (AAA) [Aeromicrobium marinum DSM 15272]|uniref:ATPase family associated with various cellular activities (AAA) n=1 Tax=Aeromicrobium marinum DSM 15272 TaxID=585531 RepID=E2SB32_9ACTN|nr:ATPase family associated with various cellular activities (AAA) [Aeromicrobium marinum DSM 15272]
MEFRDAARAVCANIETVLGGKPQAAETAVVVLLAEGHLLIEDVPGVGKTVLAKALARSVSCSVRRIQFTSDLMPSDVTGVSAFNPATTEFEFKPGPVFANIVVGDEINRASPKTQSALLEAMEERQVTVDGTTYRLASPFTVVATQNPHEMEGTYALPEAQRDRFMARIEIGYPDAAAEVDMLADRDEENPFDRLRPVVSVEDVQRMIAQARGVHVSGAVQRYVVDLVQSTRRDHRIRLGASPRASLQLVRAAKVRAAVAGRSFVLPDDVDTLAVPVLAHRLLAVRGAPSADDLVREVVASVAVPAGDLRPT